MFDIYDKAMINTVASQISRGTLSTYTGSVVYNFRDVLGWMGAKGVRNISTMQNNPFEIKWKNLIKFPELPNIISETNKQTTIVTSS